MLASCLINFTNNILLHLIQSEARAVRISVVIFMFYCPSDISLLGLLEDIPDDDDRIKHWVN